MANEKPNLSYSDFYTFNSNPTATVNPAKVGVVWINNKDKKIFICTNNTLNKNKWEEIPNIALLEGKVEDALKELEDMSQEIRTYASGLEYVNRVLIANNTYSWEYDIELELSPELYLAVGDTGAMYRGMELQFYINGKYHPVAYCHLGGSLNSVLSVVYSYNNMLPNGHLLSHRAASYKPLVSYDDTSYSRPRYMVITGYNFSRSTICLSATDHNDMLGVSGIPNNSSYYPDYDELTKRPAIHVGGITRYGVGISEYNIVKFKNGIVNFGKDITYSIPWYIYYGKETTSTDYHSRLTASRLDNELLERFKRMLVGVPYVIRLKAGETFRFRTRFSYTIEADRYSERWTGWKKCLLPVGYMAPKPVTYIN